MAGDNAVRSLLEKMVQQASNAYLGILERYTLQIYHPSFQLLFCSAVQRYMVYCCLTS